MIWVLPRLRKAAYISAGLLFIVYVLMGFRLQTGDDPFNTDAQACDFRNTFTGIGHNYEIEHGLCDRG